MHGSRPFLCVLFFLFQASIPLVVTKITIARVKPIHISRIATLCLDEFFDPQTTSPSAYKRERLWICQHLESKSKSLRSFFVAQYVNETYDDSKDVDASPVVGFVEIAMSSEYNRLLANSDILSPIRISFREQRPKISALVIPLLTDDSQHLMTGFIDRCLLSGYPTIYRSNNPSTRCV